MNEVLPSLQEAIRHSHGCDSSFLQSETIQESTNGLTIWEGEVHTFQIKHPSGAEKCYAWAESDAPGAEITAVLGAEPITSAKKAVQAALVTKIRAKIPK
jgi:hypothetical protein